MPQPLPLWAGDSFHWSYCLFNQTPYPVETKVLSSQLEIDDQFELIHVNYFGTQGFALCDRQP